MSERKHTYLHILISLFLTIFMVAGVSCVPFSFNASNSAFADTASRSGSNTEVHSAEEITAFMNSNPSTLPDVNRAALNTIKTIRYIAGIDYDLSLSDNYIERTQDAAIVCNSIGGISHYYTLSDVPETVDSSVAEKGVRALSHSNLAWSSDPSKSMRWAIIDGWMEDSGKTNLSVLGHRRWILNPSLGSTGFGWISDSTGIYATMWIGDFSSTDSDYYGVCWPAANMPLSYFTKDSAWSYSLGAAVEDISVVNVVLTRKRDGRTWYFSQNYQSDGTFFISNSGHGQPGCIMFTPKNISYSDGDEYDVQISGVKAMDGSSIRYSVSFFEDTSSLPGDFSVTSIKLNSSSKPVIKWTAATNAKYYRIYRMSQGGKWSLVKDGITSLSFTDTSASVGIKYYYRVAACRSLKGVVNEVTGASPVLIPTVTVPVSKPVIASVTATSKGVNTIKWNKVNKATGYRIYRRVYGKTTWTLIKTTTLSTTLSYKDKTAKSGTRYQYAVKSYRKNYGNKVYSSYSAWKSVRTK